MMFMTKKLIKNNCCAVVILLVVACRARRQNCSSRIAKRRQLHTWKASVLIQDDTECPGSKGVCGLFSYAVVMVGWTDNSGFLISHTHYKYRVDVIILLNCYKNTFIVTQMICCMCCISERGHLVSRPRVI